MKSVILLSCFCAAILLAGDERHPDFHVNVNMVQVRVAVTHANGQYVRNLDARDFRVTENGVEQKIRTISVPAQTDAAAATNVFILFDTSNPMYQGFVYAEDAIADFIRRLPPNDPVAIYGFSRNVTRLTPPTRDRFADMVALRHAVSGDETALYDAILVTLREAASVTGNRVIVVFSNGPDTSSVLAPVHVCSVAEDEGIPIYVISTHVRSRYAQEALQSFTSSTGGKIYYARDWQDEKAAFQAVGDDLRNSYVLAYYPSGNADSVYRKIEVEVRGENGRKYHVRARTGYRSER